MTALVPLAILERDTFLPLMCSLSWPSPQLCALPERVEVTLLNRASRLFLKHGMPSSKLLDLLIIEVGGTHLS
jgi:hypothetical protein